MYKKKMTSWLLLLVFSTFHSPALVRADSSGEGSEFVEQTTPSAPNSITTDEAEASTYDEDEDSEEPVGSPVNAQSNNEQESKRRRTIIGNFVLAGTALAVAIVSILVVSNGNGSK